MQARFDDLTPAGRSSFEFVEPLALVVARTSAEVPRLIEQVLRRVEEGLWAAGYIGYEAATAFDPSLTVAPSDPGDPFHALPLAAFGLFQHRRVAPPLVPAAAAGYAVSEWTPSVDREGFERGIATIRTHIADGDTYQVNFSFRLRAAFGGDPAGLYRDMALAQGGAHNAYLDMGRYVVASASPELFLRIEDGRITTRPMKGTARRGRWPADDISAAEGLAASEKDRAENLMIVDLVRNDLGRVCEYGTVEVDGLFEIERFQTVWQMSSTISGTLKSGAGPADVLAALFPCGSVTGAPKARTMEIIAELEDSPRRVYCGAVGYLAPPGADGPTALFNVAIRTALLDRDEGLAEYGVGGGITWASTPAGEYDECRAKALVLAERKPPFSVFETLRHDDRGWWWRDRHLDRLGESAAYFGYPFDAGAARQALAVEAAALAGPAAVRISLERDGRIATEARPLPDAPARPLRVTIDAEPVHSVNPFLFHKTSHRHMYTDRAARHPDHDDVLLVNERGEVTESTIANVAVRFGDQWWTPPLESGCLPGIHREVLLEEDRLRERVLRPEDLAVADELALVNSVRLWQPAVLVD